jgi:hypothetical protein
MEQLSTRRDTIGNIVYLVTDAAGHPIIDRKKDACAIYESFLSESDGAVCYRVCGPIPVGRRPEKVEYFTRFSHPEDQASWEACNGNGCQGEGVKFQLETGTLCSQFRLWKGIGRHRDLMVKVTLADP